MAKDIKKQKFDKRIMLGILVVAIVAVLGIGFVAAFNIGPMHFGKDKGNINQTQIQEMQNFTKSVQDAIKNNDFASWKSLMESRLTQDNFDKLVSMYQNTSQNKGNGYERMKAIHGRMMHTPFNKYGNLTNSAQDNDNDSD